MLHDVLPRPMGTHMLSVLSPIWKVQDRFGVERSKWYPYWNNAQYINVTPESVKVSFYQRPASFGKKPGLLMVISNLDPQNERTAQVSLKLDTDMFRAPFSSARNALTGQSISFNGRNINLPVKPMSAVIVEIMQ
ncbi:MAG: glycoside hydrolase domain-containing protein [Armatimonadota bacterium]